MERSLFGSAIKGGVGGKRESHELVIVNCVVGFIDTATEPVFAFDLGDRS